MQGVFFFVVIPVIRGRQHEPPFIAFGSQRGASPLSSHTTLLHVSFCRPLVVFPSTGFFLAFCTIAPSSLLTTCPNRPSLASRSFSIMHVVSARFSPLHWCISLVVICSRSKMGFFFLSEDHCFCAKHQSRSD